MKSSRIAVPNAATLAANAAAEDAIAERRYAASIDFSARTRTFRLMLRSGILLVIPASEIADLNGASPAQLAAVSLSPIGDALEQRELDVDISVPGLIRNLLGFSESQRRAGSARTPAKAAAARANGAKGGRPRKTPVPA